MQKIGSHFIEIFLLPISSIYDLIRQIGQCVNMSNADLWIVGVIILDCGCDNSGLWV